MSGWVDEVDTNTTRRHHSKPPPHISIKTFEACLIVRWRQVLTVKSLTMNTESKVKSRIVG
ncbi:hypothetical protein E2C01_003813 [Portunus trituberculatus]|uniref:Uncharacterized protein n=1 Tax=Portunus trituberculatus TaxID=210409 RepID=A0A5B7CPN0_PORTR|nr:hypothetical protein [Portunus trituberculatus]